MSNNEKGGGVGICGVVGIVFIILKLCGLIHWSWIWVLSPFWLPVALVIFLIIIAVLKNWIDDGNTPSRYKF
jgi:energy-coupling factor transporter transmembrane protein EcfT